MFLIGKPFARWVLLFVLCACAGCGGDRVRVEGTITLDGAPVEGGSISLFQGSGPGSDKGNAPILGGKYAIEGERAKNLAPGSYTVQIHWIQKLGKPGSNADTSPAVKQLIPPKYNTKSTLTREIALGTNKLDFELTST
jgi:hypothetical protein